MELNCSKILLFPFERALLHTDILFEQMFIKAPSRHRLCQNISSFAIFYEGLKTGKTKNTHENNFNKII